MTTRHLVAFSIGVFAYTAHLAGHRDGSLAPADWDADIRLPITITLTLPPMEAKVDPSSGSTACHGKAKPFRAALGETQLWTIRNDSDWDHPMHLHGYFFMPVDERGAPLRPMRWKDTITVPMKSTARFLVTFDEPLDSGCSTVTSSIMPMAD